MKEAEDYAKSITKNETYQKYLIEAFTKGYELAHFNVTKAYEKIRLNLERMRNNI